MTNQFDVVSLNVGGKKFTTYYDTLKQSTYFQQLMSDGQASGAIIIKNDDGQIDYFIDRDGRLFEDVLNYLRSLKVCAIDREHLEKLLVEASFFKLDEMASKVQKMLMLEDYEESNSATRFELVSNSKTTTSVNVGDSTIQTIGEEDGGTIIAGINYRTEGDREVSQFVKMIPRKN